MSDCFPNLGELSDYFQILNILRWHSLQMLNIINFYNKLKNKVGLDWVVSLISGLVDQIKKCQPVSQSKIKNSMKKFQLYEHPSSKFRYLILLFVGWGFLQGMLFGLSKMAVWPSVFFSYII